MCCWATAAVGNSAKQRRGGPIRPRFPGNSRQAVVSPDTLGNVGSADPRGVPPPPKNARKNAHDGGVVYGLQPVQKIGPPLATRRRPAARFHGRSLPAADSLGSLCNRLQHGS